MTAGRTRFDRFDRFDVAMAAAAAAAGCLLVWLGLGLTFFWDEWEFIASRSLGDPMTWFVPHNEHWSTVPVLLYRSLVETVGLGSYVPYQALLVGIHLVVAVAVYVLVRRTSGRWIALAGGALVLLFGSGFENLFWAFQIGFTGTTALCLMALLVLDGAPTGRRVALLLMLHVAGLATSGLGLAMAVVVGTEVLLRPAWRRHVWILAIGAAVFGAWFLLIGRTGLGVQGNPFSMGSLVNVPRTVIEGIGSSAGALTGLGPALGIVPGLAVYVFASRRALARTLPVRSAACLLGIIALYVVVGLARTAHPEGSGDAPRLVYFSGPLLLVGLAAMVGRPAWPPASSRAQAIALASVAVVLALSAIWNVVLLARGHDLFVQRAEITRALLTVELAPDRRGQFDRSRPLALVPSADVLESIVARYGSPLRDSLTAVPPVSAGALAKAEQYLLNGGPIPVP